MPSIFAQEPPTNRAAAGGANEQGDKIVSVLEADAERGKRDADVQQQQQQPALRTSGEAFRYCEDLVQTQLAAASAEAPEPNTPMRGDTAARLAILLLLNDRQQRRLFLNVANRSSAWPRLRPLFGAPPYNFLLPQDAGALRAGGFARARANMTYEESRTANVAQFGPGQFEDQHTREYRVVPRGDDDTLPIGSGFFDSENHLVLQVKVKKHAGVKKRALVHSAFKKQLFFPQPGETLVLQETKSMLSAMGVRTPKQTVLRVRALIPRGEGASTATITLVR